jgi:methylated-DNA-[protein]-cysteine S-methyltransferase
MNAKRDDSLSFDVWATAWGPMGAVASPAGLRRVVLPHYAFGDLVDLLAWEHPGAARSEAPFEALIRLSRDYFNARAVNFDEVLCDLPKESTFAGIVLRACRQIPYARTMSYSQLAMQIGREDAARAVATAMGKNPVPLVVPCHRVTYADGRAGGFSAPGGPELKQRMLDLEEKGGGIVD